MSDDDSNFDQEMESVEDDSEDSGERVAALDDDMSRIAGEFAELKERLYREKLADLNTEIRLLEEASHPDYTGQMQLIEQKRANRIMTADLLRKFQLENIAHQFAAEKKEADQECQRSQQSASENLMQTLQEKLKKMEEEKNSRDVAGDLDAGRSAAVTRNQRRRANEAASSQTRRKQNITHGPNIFYSLKENDIMEDLFNIRRGKMPTNTARAGRAAEREKDANGLPLAEVDSYCHAGKLFYDKEEFDLQQSVWVESQDPPLKFSGVITSITPAEIQVQKAEQKKLAKIYMSHLRAGKSSIRAAIR